MCADMLKSAGWRRTWDLYQTQRLNRREETEVLPTCHLRSLTQLPQLHSHGLSFLHLRFLGITQIVEPTFILSGAFWFTQNNLPGSGFFRTVLVWITEMHFITTKNVTVVLLSALVLGWVHVQPLLLLLLPLLLLLVILLLLLLLVILLVILLVRDVKLINNHVNLVAGLNESVLNENL